MFECIAVRPDVQKLDDDVCGLCPSPLIGKDSENAFRLRVGFEIDYICDACAKHEQETEGERCIFVLMSPLQAAA